MVQSMCLLSVQKVNVSVIVVRNVVLGEGGRRHWQCMSESNHYLTIINMSLLDALDVVADQFADGAPAASSSTRLSPAARGYAAYSVNKLHRNNYVEQRFRCRKPFRHSSDA